MLIYQNYKANKFNMLICCVLNQFYPVAECFFILLTAQQLLNQAVHRQNRQTINSPQV